MININIFIIVFSIISLNKPASICGYEPNGTIFDINPSSIISCDNNGDNQFTYKTSKVVIITDGELRIVSIGVMNKEYIDELSISIPCKAKQLFEILGVPNKTNDNQYIYTYNIGKRDYSLYLFQDKNNSDTIDMVLLCSNWSSNYFADWIKQTKAYSTSNK